ADARIFRASHIDDGRHSCQRFYVVDQCRTMIEPHYGGEIRRLQAWVASLSFQRFQERGLFSADVGTASRVYVDLQGKAGTQDVVAQKSRGPRFGNGALEDGEYPPELAPHVDVRCVRADSEAGQDHPFYQQVRDMFQQIAVFEGAGFTFVGIANEIHRLASVAV